MSIAIKLDDVVVFKPTFEGLWIWKTYLDTKFPLDTTPFSYLQARLDMQGMGRLPFYKFVQIFGGVLDSDMNYVPTYFAEDIRIEAGNGEEGVQSAAAMEFQRRRPELPAVLARHGIEVKVISHEQLQVRCATGEYLVAYEQYASRQELILDIVTATDQPLGAAELVSLLDDDEQTTQLQQFRKQYLFTWKSLTTGGDGWKRPLEWFLTKENELLIRFKDAFYRVRLDRSVTDGDLFQGIVEWYQRQKQQRARRRINQMLIGVWLCIGGGLLAAAATHGAHPLIQAGVIVYFPVSLGWKAYRMLNESIS